MSRPTPLPAAPPFQRRGPTLARPWPLLPLALADIAYTLWAVASVSAGPPSSPSPSPSASSHPPSLSPNLPLSSNSLLLRKHWRWAGLDFGASDAPPPAFIALALARVAALLALHHPRWRQRGGWVLALTGGTLIACVWEVCAGVLSRDGQRREVEGLFLIVVSDEGERRREGRWKALKGIDLRSVCRRDAESRTTMRGHQRQPSSLADTRPPRSPSPSSYCSSSSCASPQFGHTRYARRPAAPPPFPSRRTSRLCQHNGAARAIARPSLRSSRRPSLRRRALRMLSRPSRAWGRAMAPCRSRRASRPSGPRRCARRGGMVANCAAPRPGRRTRRDTAPTQTTMTSRLARRGTRPTARTAHPRSRTAASLTFRRRVRCIPSRWTRGWRSSRAQSRQRLAWCDAVQVRASGAASKRVRGTGRFLDSSCSRLS